MEGEERMSELSEYVKAVEDYRQTLHRRFWLERVCWLVLVVIVFLFARNS